MYLQCITTTTINLCTANGADLIRSTVSLKYSSNSDAILRKLTNGTFFCCFSVSFPLSSTAFSRNSTFDIDSGLTPSRVKSRCRLNRKSAFRVVDDRLLAEIELSEHCFVFPKIKV